MSSFVEHQVKTYTATAALAAYIRVKLVSGEVVVAGLNEVAIGVTLANVAAGGLVPVRLFNSFGTAFMTAGAAITRGAAVFGAASGKIDDTGVGPAIGYAEEAATADGDVIEVLLRGQIAPAAVAGASQAVATDATSVITLANALRSALITHGIITGAA